VIVRWNGLACAVSAAIYLFFPSYGTAEQYLCVPDKITGFDYNSTTKEWDYARFKTNFQYIIAPAKDRQFSYAVTKIGDKEPNIYCENELNDGGYLFCNLLGISMVFNKINRRYLIISQEGYVSAGVGGMTDPGIGAPWVQIGKCSPF
jgi:hypothetical protein